MRLQTMRRWLDTGYIVLLRIKHDHDDKDIVMPFLNFDHIVLMANLFVLKWNQVIIR